MGQKNALEIILGQMKKDPQLQLAYLNEKNNFQIGCNIRRYRNQAKITQAQLAARIKTKQLVISRLENAEYQGHSLPILRKIARALNEPIEHLLGTQKRDRQTLIKHNQLKSNSKRGTLRT
jgi:transcriptional regulator with XRE-family HTH domain